MSYSLLCEDPPQVVCPPKFRVRASAWIKIYCGREPLYDGRAPSHALQFARHLATVMQAVQSRLDQNATTDLKLAA